MKKSEYPTYFAGRYAEIGIRAILEHAIRLVQEIVFNEQVAKFHAEHEMDAPLQAVCAAVRVFK